MNQNELDFFYKVGVTVSERVTTRRLYSPAFPDEDKYLGTYSPATLPQPRQQQTCPIVAKVAA